ncbi:MAG TPA: hypothetical protein VM840_05320 [Actinomycetota bacterium]|nr:hypothetical protein [Actinomycetota bacterium]
MRGMRVLVLLGLAAVLLPAGVAAGAENHCVVKIYSRPPTVAVPGGPTVVPNASTTGIARCTTGVDAVPAPLYPLAGAAFAQLDGAPATDAKAFPGVFTGSKLPAPVPVTFSSSGGGKFQSGTIQLDPTRPGDLTVIAYHPAGELRATYTGTP